MAQSINGFLVFDSPVYRGNSKKTIFTRGNSQQDISLPGRISGSAQAMMSAFTGFWQNRNNPRNNNYGLLEQLWNRLYSENMPDLNLQVSCTLDKKITEKNPYFDLRMGIAIDRDRMAQAKDQNFRLETVYKGSRFLFSLSFDENRLNSQNKVKFAFLIEEMVQGRFWFGAQKSAGMGNCHLELDQPSKQLIAQYQNIQNQAVALSDKSNYVFIHLNITPDNPLLVSWPWGNEDEKGNRDTWVDAVIKDTEEHKHIMDGVLGNRLRTWNDIEREPGGTKFKNTHLRRGEPMEINQLRRNFAKGVKNDDTIIKFLAGHREKVLSEIDREPHLDFRADKGAVMPGKPYDDLFYRALSWMDNQTAWEMVIPGNTIKGAFRTKAQQILRTLHNGKGCSEKTSSHQGRFCDDRFCPVCSLFGRQGEIAKVFCSDAHLENNGGTLDDEQFSYDQIQIDPKTGKSRDNSKLDLLYAYGKKFSFNCVLTLKDINPEDLGQLGFLMYLLKEFENGATPFGGRKTLNFGHIHGKIDRMEFLCSAGSGMETQLKRWNIIETGSEQLWHRYQLDGDKIWDNKPFTNDMQQKFSQMIKAINVPEKPFKTADGYISHRQYSKMCGTLTCELEALTPLHIKESGEPSFKRDDIYGYDFFSISPPKNEKKQPINSREYAIPPSSIKGAIRSIYNLISANSCSGCTDISKLCDTCQLFGWVGNGSSGESALMGRLKFSFARPVDPLSFEWYGVVFGYKGEKSFSVANTRIFPHTDKINSAISTYGADTPVFVEKNTTLNRFAMPGSRFRFQVDFTNLTHSELKKIIWALELENGLAHKLGKSKALHFGSCQINIVEACFIDWGKRFSSLHDLGKTPFDVNSFRPDAAKIARYQELKRALSLP